MQAENPGPIIIPTKSKDPARLALLHWSVLGFSLLVFGIACLCPAVIFDQSNGGQSTMIGAEVLFLGALGAFIGQFGWFSHIPLGFALFFYLLRYRKISLFCTGLALIIALDSFLLFGQPVPENEAITTMMTLNHFGPGFYLWMLSMLIAFVGTLIVILLKKREAGSTDEAALQIRQNPL